MNVNRNRSLIFASIRREDPSVVASVPSRDGMGLQKVKAKRALKKHGLVRCEGALRLG